MRYRGTKNPPKWENRRSTYDNKFSLEMWDLVAICVLVPNVGCKHTEILWNKMSHKISSQKLIENSRDRGIFHLGTIIFASAKVRSDFHHLLCQNLCPWPLEQSPTHKKKGDDIVDRGFPKSNSKFGISPWIELNL